MSIKYYRVGEEKLNIKGNKMKIIKYNGVYDIDVEFENGVIRKNVTYLDFKRGALINVDYSKRIGEIRHNSYGSKMTVVDYKDTKNVHIKFDNGYNTVVVWSNFDKGNIKSPYCKSLNGVGYVGEGEYTYDDKWYDYWRSMIERVTSNNNGNLRTYIEATLCEDWYNYQNFAKWAEENYYQVQDLKMELDKDILVKGNKLYSPETCVFVPHNINTLFVKADKSRGDLPIGAYWHERDQEYRAQCSYITDKGVRKNKWLGGYDNPEDAYMAYKRFKESHIKDIAEKYKEYIPDKLYKALYKYQVEIDD